MFKNIFIYGMLLFLPSLLLGQKAKIAFENTSFDMGIIPETGGKVTYHFQFINRGKAPLIIKYVESSCGCTIPKWNRRPILPQDSGTITVTFNPKDRPGVFTKKIIVYTNATHPNTVLKISGEVIAKPVNILQEYPFRVGDLRFNADTINLQQLHNKQQVITFINTGKKNISILSILKPDYLSIDCTPLTLEKGMMGNLIIRYIPTAKDKITPSDRVLIKTTQGDTQVFPITGK